MNDKTLLNLIVILIITVNVLSIEGYISFNSYIWVILMLFAMGLLNMFHKEPSN